MEDTGLEPALQVHEMEPRKILQQSHGQDPHQLPGKSPYRVFL